LALANVFGQLKPGTALGAITASWSMDWVRQRRAK
jgi:hypothetical protein